jgi:hypothetical protein
MSRRNERSTQRELDGATHWVIQRAARRAPESLSSRLEEEWLADLESRATSLSRLRFAVGCCWATMVIVFDQPRSRVPAMSPAAPGRGYVTLADRNFCYFSLRSGTLFLIVGIHAAVFCGLITTFAHTGGLATRTKLQSQMLTPRSPEVELTDFSAGK